MNSKLVAIIFVGIAVAMLPVIVKVVDQLYLSKLSSTYTTPPTLTMTTALTTKLSEATITSQSASSTTTASVTYTVIEPEAVSHLGADTLIVKPARVVANPGAIVPITITVRFKHAQPCPYASWQIELKPSGGIEVVSKSGSLVDRFDYVMNVKVRVNSSGQLQVVYLYGKGCPYGSKEVVTVVFEVK